VREAKGSKEKTRRRIQQKNNIEPETASYKEFQTPIGAIIQVIQGFKVDRSPSL
jgi:hypothetical protein